ncbi:fork head domain-containing protein FD4 [Ceratina calcarata]|uniref:Fork head domain-containing protein FD4 n=1 Tax=Ceratina calcarata TaxID=156304 RepID=A0AAJ7N9M1_9HYME|nr:fork head domain-containing protein FD4 [Ceratina calcarata]
MCSNESPPPAKEPLAVGLGNPMAGFLPGLEHYRLQLYHYAMAERLRLAQQLHPQHPGVGQPPSSAPTHLGMGPGFPAPLPLYPAAAAAAGYPSRFIHPALSMALLHPHHQRIPEEPKPQHSYIGLIAMAILSSPEKKLVLSDIYQYILEHYPYFRTRGPGWRNSIRHNLSLNDCFVKSGRSANGKGHYWTIHPINLEDFRRGDFRRRKAQRKVRKYMGLAVDEEPDSPSPPPLPPTPPPASSLGPPVASQPLPGIWTPHHQQQQPQQQQQQFQSQTLNRQSSSFQPSSRKRQFDVASLLAPDDQQHQIESDIRSVKTRRFSCSEDELHDLQEPDQDEEDVDVDVVAETNAVPSPNTPSASPDSKIVSSAGHWTTQPVQATGAQQMTALHLQNHLQARNYYVPVTSSTGPTV